MLSNKEGTREFIGAIVIVHSTGPLSNHFGISKWVPAAAWTIKAVVALFVWMATTCFYSW